MQLFAKLLELLELEMTRPGNYGWFHLLFVGIVIAVTVLLCCFFRRSEERLIRRIALISWIVLVVLELYKQIVFNLDFEEGKFVWDYSWYAFPYQFCSTPMYVLPFVAFLREGKARDACIAFMLSFSLFAGIAVFCYPNDVFTETIGINIQTMVHHGLQVALGIFFAVKYASSLKVKFFLRGISVYCILIAVAMLVNIAGRNLLVHYGIDETFNMFYISPYFECTLPVLSSIYPVVPYPVFLFIYILGFSLAAAIVTLIMKGANKLVIFTYGKIKANG